MFAPLALLAAAALPFVALLGACSDGGTPAPPPFAPPGPSATPPVGSPAAPVDAGLPLDSGAPDGHTGDPPITATPIVPPVLFTMTDWPDARPGVGVDTTSGATSPVCVTAPLVAYRQASAGAGSAEASYSADDFLDQMGFGTLPFSVSLRNLPAVRDAAAGMAFGPNELESLRMWGLTEGGVELDPGELLHAVPGVPCPEQVARAVVYGARLAYGLKLRFPSDDARYAFERARPFGVDTIRTLDARALGWLGDDWKDRLTVQVVAFQIGGDVASLRAIVTGSRCTIGDLASCKETLAALDAHFAAFGDGLGKAPTATDPQGWCPVSLAPVKTSELIIR